MPDVLIVRDPGICGGDPVIAGTRILASHVHVCHTKLGWSVGKIISEYPHLKRREVEAALTFIIANPKWATTLEEDGCDSRAHTVYPNHTAEQSISCGSCLMEHQLAALYEKMLDRRQYEFAAKLRDIIGRIPRRLPKKALALLPIASEIIKAEKKG